MIKTRQQTRPTAAEMGKFTSNNILKVAPIGQVRWMEHLIFQSRNYLEAHSVKILIHKFNVTKIASISWGSAIEE